jgi:hypothetical protein
MSSKNNEIKTKYQICLGVCKLELELNNTNFDINKNRKNGFFRKCKECRKKEIYNYIIIENNVKYQVCTGKCKRKLELNENNFDWRNDNAKFRRQCKTCINEYIQESWQKPEVKEKRKQSDKKSKEKNKEKNKERKAKHYQNNKEEILKDAKIYRDKPENKERQKLYGVQYRNKPEVKEKNKIYNKEYRERPGNKEKRNKADRKKESERRKTDPAYRLRMSISRSVRTMLKKNKSSKHKKSFLNYVSYTMEELREYIEKQFLELGNEWMTWDNWTVYNPLTWDDNDPSTWVWQLDHIIPQSDLPYESMEEENFQKSWALSNLRPYSAKQNAIDGATRVRHNI